MCYYEKTLLYAYPHVEDFVVKLEKSVLAKAISSFSDYGDAERQLDKVATIIYRRNKLLDLKEKLDEILSLFTKEETYLIEYKYYKMPPKQGLDVTSRTYFRKQERILKKLSLILEKRGYDEKWFLHSYGDIWFLKYIFDKQKKTYIHQQTLKELNKNSKKQIKPSAVLPSGNSAERVSVYA